MLVPVEQYVRAVSVEKRTHKTQVGERLERLVLFVGRNGQELVMEGGDLDQVGVAAGQLSE